MADSCFTSLLNRTAYLTCQLKDQVNFIERYLGISGGTTLGEVDNCTISNVPNLHLIAQQTTVPLVAGTGRTGYFRDTIIAQRPCGDNTGTNFYLDLPWSTQGYGMAMGWNHTFPTNGLAQGSAILGGQSNTINSSSTCSVICGGMNNQLTGNYSVAMGQGAIVNKNYSFVFSGSTPTTSPASNSFTIGADLYYPNHGATSTAILTSLNGNGLATWDTTSIVSGTWTPVLGPGSTAISDGYIPPSGVKTLYQSIDPNNTNTGSYMKIGNIVQFSAIYYLKTGGTNNFSSIDITSNLPLGRTGPPDMPGLIGSYILFDVPLQNINQQVVSFRYFHDSTIDDNYTIKIASNTGYPPGITNGIYMGDGRPFTVFVTGQYSLV